MRRTIAETIERELLFVVGLLLFLSPLLAQTASGQQAKAAQTIPDLSGIWDAANEQNPLYARAEEIYKATRQEGNEVPNDFGREDANPWFSACTPLGPSALMKPLL